MPADEYNKKMAAKKAKIEANKAKGGAKKAGGLFSFGKKEAANFPGIKRRAGTPTLVVIGAGFEEYGVYDCDAGGNGLKLIEGKGAAAREAVVVPIDPALRFRRLWARHACRVRRRA